MYRGSAWDTYLRVYTNISTTVAGATDTAGPYVSAGGTSWSSASDTRLKENWISIEDVLTKLSLLTTGTFQWIARPTSGRTYGLIAQEVQQNFPEMVTAYSEGYLGIQYIEMVPVLVKAVQLLTQQNTELQTQLAAVMSKLGM